MRFANPEWLQLLWIVPVMLVLSWLTARAKAKRISRGLGQRLTPFLARNVSPGRKRLRTTMRLIGLTFAILGLARPQMGKGQSEIKVRGVEMMVVLDVSTSMLAEDIKPSRLQFAKAELARLFDMLSGDKVGLVGFAGSALLLSPLTNDITSLKMFLDSLSPYSIESQGTDFARALQEAHDAFERGGVEDDDQIRTTRVILVLSDGEDQEKGALELAKKFSGEGVKIFTMAFGTERGGMIPIRDERGYLRSYKKDRAGKEVISQVKGKFLKDLARAGGGAFHFASFGGNEASAIKEDIDRLQKAEFASSMSTQYEEKFQIFLFLALAFLALDLLVGERAPGERVWRGRFESGLSSVMVLIAVGGLAAEARAGVVDEFRGVRENNRAVGDLKAERPVEALDGFSKALGNLPDDPVVHYNLGTSFSANKDAAKAASEYDVALSLNPSPELAFKINFNRASAYAEQKKFDEALAAFQAALKLKPDSKEVKKNIELLLQSGDGDGQSDNQQPKPNEKPDDKNKDQKQNQSQPNQQQQQPQTGPTPKPTPRPFKSEQLSQQDVGRILEELKRQEDQIREKMQREGGKDAPRDKDW